MRSDIDYRIVDFSDEESLMFLTGNHRMLAVDRQLGERLRSGFEQLSEAERAEWDRLVQLGVVSGENAAVLRGSTVADGADLAINVNLTNVCNLACTYCFAEGGDYGRIKDAMGHDSVDHIFAFVEENLTPSRSVRLELFGGEPLANFATLREVCERSERFGAEHGVSFVYRISTNLTLMPPGALELFARHRFIVSVSIDGGRTVQDRNRPAKGGQGSYDRVMRNVVRVREASDDITLVARMTIAQREPSVVDNMHELYDLNLFDYFQIYPGVFPEADDPAAAGKPASRTVFLDMPAMPGKPAAPSPAPSGGSCATPSVTPGERYINFFLQDGMVEQFRDFLAEYPRLFRPDNRFKGVLEYERTVEMALDGKLALSFCSGGRTYFTHSPDHSISPCHRLVGEPAFDVGRGETGLDQNPVEWRRTVDDHPVCGQCWARYVCGGGCKQENFVASGDLNVLNEESCRYQLLLTEEVLRMAARSSAGYRARDRRQLADLFVSCGRPVMDNGRVPVPAAAAATHFRQI